MLKQLKINVKPFQAYKLFFGPVGHLSRDYGKITYNSVFGLLFFSINFNDLPFEFEF
jgi:hypothetical protein